VLGIDTSHIMYLYSVACSNFKKIRLLYYYYVTW